MGLLLRMLLRDWRGGELSILLLALILAVTMVSGISGFASALKNALRQESHSFLAADLAIRDARPLPSEWTTLALERGLNTAEILTFPSMTFSSEGAMVLSSVKAVSDAYPLRGFLRLSDSPFGELREAVGAPERGTVWLEPRLFALLAVEVGDSVEIGQASFRVAGAVRSEPDRAGGFLGVGPRVMLHADDIPATGVVQPGSRVSYRRLYAGDPAIVAQFADELAALLQPGQELQSVETSQPSVAQALERAERFLLLAGSLAVVLASIAVALASRRYAQRHQKHVALLKSLGSSSGRVRTLYAGSLALTWAVGLLLGWFAAWGLQSLALQAFAEQLTVTPSILTPRPYLVGAVTALVCVSCFAWPSLSRLAVVSPLRVLRSDLPVQASGESRDYLIAIGAIGLLMFWYSADFELTLVVLAGLMGIAIIGGLIAYLLLRGGREAGTQAGSIWRLALASLLRHGVGNALQLVVFAVAIMLLLLLGLLRTSLLDGWQQQLPDDAPNHFVLNLAPEEVDDVAALLDGASIRRESLYPMLRGRIVAVNEEPLPFEAEPDEPQQRESNFTWSNQLPTGNELVEGRWWSPGETNFVSIEAEFAENMGIELGDQLQLRIGAAQLEAEVLSLRKLDWESFKPNFFMVFPKDFLSGYPTTYMTSFFLPPEQKSFLNELLKQHPTATVIEVDAIMEQLRSTLAQVSNAIELVLLLVLGAGALVLVAGVQSTTDLRMRESALLRALGARRNHLLGSVAIEFAALGAMAGLLAVVAGESAFWALQSFAFELDYKPTPGLWPLAMLTAVGLITALGLWSCRRVVSVEPIRVLREL
ncbi:MAG: FtsX-like permease family protein [Pseudomonadota bacterium]